MKKAILGNVLENNLLSLRSSTDRFPGRKFSSSMEGIKNKFTEMYEYNPDSIYLLNKVLKCYNVNKTYGSNKFDRYMSTLKKDIYALPTLLGLNESIKECHQQYVAVYDMSKLHTVVLSVLLGESPRRVKVRLEEYLKSKGIDFTKYLNYIINGINSDVIEKGFSTFEMVNYVSNSYLNLKRIADSKKVSVTELIRLYIIKYNEVVFNKFMSEMEEKNKNVLVQSVGLDILIISGGSKLDFDDLRFVTYKNAYKLSAEIIDVNDFNKEVPKYYLNRKLVGVC